jgi:hypothetical protein
MATPSPSQQGTQHRADANRTPPDTSPGR